MCYYNTNQNETIWKWMVAFLISSSQWEILKKNFLHIILTAIIAHFCLSQKYQKILSDINGWVAIGRRSSILLHIVFSCFFFVPFCHHENCLNYLKYRRIRYKIVTLSLSKLLLNCCVVPIILVLFHFHFNSKTKILSTLLQIDLVTHI